MKIAYDGDLTSKRVHPYLVNASTMLQLNYPYFGEIFRYNNIIETTQIPTCGINFTINGANFYYNPDFIGALEQEEVTFIVIHEIYHELFDHWVRTTRNYAKSIANIAQDMIINELILLEINPKLVKMPVAKRGTPTETILGVRLPKFPDPEYKDEWIFEHLYTWLFEQYQEFLKKNPEFNQQKNGNGQPQQQPGQGSGQDKQDGGAGSPSQKPGQGQQPQSGNGQQTNKGQQPGNNQQTGGGSNQSQRNTGRNGPNKNDDGTSTCAPHADTLENTFKNLLDGDVAGQGMDKHLEDDIPQELRREIIKDIVEGIRARGLSDGNFEKLLGQLVKRKKDYLKEIKRAVAHIKGRKKKDTWMRENRRDLPMKGFTKHGVMLNVLLDTSGSMGGYFDKIISYIFQNDISINMVQCDTRVYDLGEIKNKKHLLKMRIHGCGGTILQPGLDHIAKNYNRFNTVILTDGCTDRLDLKKLKGRVLVLSVGTPCPIQETNNKLKQIVVPEE